MTTTVQVLGADRLASTMNAAADQLAELAQAEGATSDVVSALARALAPRRTGVLAGSVGSAPERGAAVIVATAVYAGPIHYGWPARNIDPQPFIDEAVAASQGQWVPLYSANVQDVLDKIRGL